MHISPFYSSHYHHASLISSERNTQMSLRNCCSWQETIKFQSFPCRTCLLTPTVFTLLVGFARISGSSSGSVGGGVAPNCPLCSLRPRGDANASRTGCGTCVVSNSATRRWHLDLYELSTVLIGLSLPSSLINMTPSSAVKQKRRHASCHIHCSYD